MVIMDHNLWLKWLFWLYNHNSSATLTNPYVKLAPILRKKYKTVRHLKKYPPKLESCGNPTYVSKIMVISSSVSR